MRNAALLLLLLMAPAAAQAARAPRLSQRDARFSNIKVHYYSSGRGEDALVFVHGWSCDSTFWSAQLDHFALSGTHVIAIDLPGHGKSDKPFDASYDMNYFAAAVAAVLDDAGVKRAVLVGHSMGTPVIRQFYRNNPQRTLALVAVEGALRPFSDDPKLGDRMSVPLRSSDYQTTAGKMIDSMLSPAATSDVQAHVRQVMLATPQSVMVKAMKAMFDPAIWISDTINVPLLVINSPSAMWTDDYRSFITSIAAASEYAAIEGTDHFVMMEKPDEFNARLDAFLNSRALLPHEAS